MPGPWRRRSLGAASLFGGVKCCCDWETRDGGGLLRQKRADYPVKPDNVILYGQYVLDRALVRFLMLYFRRADRF